MYSICNSVPLSFILSEIHLSTYRFRETWILSLFSAYVIPMKNIFLYVSAHVIPIIHIFLYVSAYVIPIIHIFLYVSIPSHFRHMSTYLFRDIYLPGAGWSGVYTRLPTYLCLCLSIYRSVCECLGAYVCVCARRVHLCLKCVCVCLCVSVCVCVCAWAHCRVIRTVVPSAQDIYRSTLWGISTDLLSGGYLPIYSLGDICRSTLWGISADLLSLIIY